jgi:DNA-binding transcriptional LysR family regulator
MSVSLGRGCDGVDSPRSPRGVQKSSAARTAAIYKDGVVSEGDCDWDDLRIFIAAVRARSLAGAARTLGVEHSTVGRRLTALERSLGAALLFRLTDGVRTTPLGQSVLPLVEQAERAVRSLLVAVAEQRSRVRLALPSGAAGLLTPHLPDLRARHPEIVLEILSGSRPVDLRAGEAELALRVGAVKDPELIVRRVGEGGWSLYGSPNYLARRGRPRDPRQLSGHELIGFDPALAATPGARWIAEFGRQATIAMRGREMIDLVAAAVEGVGLAVLPCMLGDGESRLVRATDEVLGRHPLSLVCRRELQAVPAVRAVMRFVAAAVRKNAGLLGGVPSARGSRQ